MEIRNIINSLKNEDFVIKGINVSEEDYKRIVTWKLKFIDQDLQVLDIDFNTVCFVDRDGFIVDKQFSVESTGIPNGDSFLFTLFLEVMKDPYLRESIFYYSFRSEKLLYKLLYPQIGDWEN